VIRELAEKAERVIPDAGVGWQITYTFFAREGFTEAARREAGQLGAMLLSPEEMERDL
jgi:hypothetical protein